MSAPLVCDFELRRGSFELSCKMNVMAPITALFGPSGSGKTTLLQVLAGVLRPRSGHVQLGDRRIFDQSQRICLPPRSRHVGLVFQDLRLFPHRRVEQNLLYGWRLQARARDRLEPKEVIEALEIGALLRRWPHELSGGERQRVALGRALLAMPELLLMDEPLASVDWVRRRRILPYLRWVQERLSIPVIYVSHSLPEILELTDQVVVLDDGAVVGQGEVFEVLGRSLHGALAEDVATESLLPVKVTHSHEEGWNVRAVIGEQQVVLPFDARVSPGTQGRVAIRPQDVMLSRDRLTGVSARNQIEGRVERVTSLHGRRLVHVRVGPEAIMRAELTEDAMVELSIEPGARVYCVVKTSAFRWL